MDDRGYRMNRYKYEEIFVGQTEEFYATVTEENTNEFRKMSGDENPLHKDNEYAKDKGFQQKVVFGMLSSIYYSTLVGVYLPGERCLLHSIDIKFKSPIYVDDKLVIFGEVVEKNDLFKLVLIKATIKKQDGGIASKAKIELEVL